MSFIALSLRLNTSYIAGEDVFIFNFKPTRTIILVTNQMNWTIYKLKNAISPSGQVLSHPQPHFQLDGENLITHLDKLKEYLKY